MGGNINLNLTGTVKVKKLPLKIVIAIDSFKGSMTSMQAGEAAAEGIRRVFPESEITVCPLADGGEGTADTLAAGMGGTMQRISVTGPLGTPVECEYGILSDNETAVIEIASAAGLTLVPEKLRNPLETTTYGVGEIIRDAVRRGCRRFIAGIGGSATNDGGAGMLQALGYGLLDSDGNQIPRGARGLKNLAEITSDNVMPELRRCSFRIACDVTNPLCGENGASTVFGPQKGAYEQMAADMDEWMRHYADIAAQSFRKANPSMPGTGAAGGLGFAFLTFTDAVLEPGAEIVLEETGLEKYIEQADIVVTGEGRLDAQTVMGKAPIYVAEAAKKYGKHVIAFAGSVAQSAAVCNSRGIDAMFPILRDTVTLEEAMKTENAVRNMADTAEQVFRIYKFC